MITVKTRKLTKFQRALVKDACHFVCKKFMPRIKNLEFVVKGDENLLSKSYTYGDCIWTDDAKPPREFMINIDTTISPRLFLETFMHELVHVKQYAKGELGWYERSEQTKWKGQAVSRKMSYYDYPWEIEARGREYGLCEQFLENNKKWVRVINEGFTDYKLLGHTQMVLPFDR